MKSLIYGASGLTGSLTARKLSSLTSDFVIAGRSQSKLKSLAAELGVEYRTFGLQNSTELEKHLVDIDTVLHVAGPFSTMAEPMLRACLNTNTHYLDVSAEGRSIELVARYHQEALAKNIMLLPGIGVDVVPSDCLAMQVVSRLPSAKKLAFGISLPKTISAGSARNIISQMDHGVLIRRNSKICEIDVGVLERYFDYGDGPSNSGAISWGDVSSAYYSTGIGDITCYLESTPFLRFAMGHSNLAWGFLKEPMARFFTDSMMEMFFSGPTEQQQEETRGAIVVEAEDHKGNLALSRMHIPESYSFTAEICADVTYRVHQGCHQIGYQTPGRLFGADYIQTFEGVSIEHLH